MAENMPEDGELMIRLSWGPREESLEEVARKLRSTAGLARLLGGLFDHDLALLDGERVCGYLDSLSDDDLVEYLRLHVATNSDGSPLPQDGYFAHLESAPGQLASAMLTIHVGATRTQFSAGNTLSLSVSQDFSPDHVDTGLFMSNRGDAVLRDLVTLWRPKRAGVYLAEALDAYITLDLAEELGLVTYLAECSVASTPEYQVEHAGKDSWIHVLNVGVPSGLNARVERLVDASRKLSQSHADR
ncbi:hypothetical protein ACLBWP_02265 [Microbacterium sp. M1A1_1b]